MGLKLPKFSEERAAEEQGAGFVVVASEQRSSSRRRGRRPPEARTRTQTCACAPTLSRSCSRTTVHRVCVRIARVARVVARLCAADRAPSRKKDAALSRPSRPCLSAASAAPVPPGAHPAAAVAARALTCDAVVCWGTTLSLFCVGPEQPADVWRPPSSRRLFSPPFRRHNDNVVVTAFIIVELRAPR